MPRIHKPPMQRVDQENLVKYRGVVFLVLRGKKGKQEWKEVPYSALTGWEKAEPDKHLAEPSPATLRRRQQYRYTVTSTHRWW